MPNLAAAYSGLMQRLNPTGSLLRARPFVARNDYIFALLCLLNVNMGALNTSPALVGMDGTLGGGVGAERCPGESSVEMVLAQGLLDDMAGVFQEVRYIFMTTLAGCKVTGLLRKTLYRLWAGVRKSDASTYSPCKQVSEIDRGYPTVHVICVWAPS